MCKYFSLHRAGRRIFVSFQLLEPGVGGLVDQNVRVHGQPRDALRVAGVAQDDQLAPLLGRVHHIRHFHHSAYMIE